MFEKIKKGEYDFLGTYLDFSNIKELIYQLEREGLKKKITRRDKIKKDNIIKSKRKYYNFSVSLPQEFI